MLVFWFSTPSTRRRRLSPSGSLSHDLARAFLPVPWWASQSMSTAQMKPAREPPAPFHTSSQWHRSYEYHKQATEEQFLDSSTTSQANQTPEFKESSPPGLSGAAAPRRRRFNDGNPLRWTLEMLSLLLGMSSLLGEGLMKARCKPTESNAMGRLSNCCCPLARKRPLAATETPGPDAEHVRRLLQLRSEGCFHVPSFPGPGPAEMVVVCLDDTETAFRLF